MDVRSLSIAERLRLVERVGGSPSENTARRHRYRWWRDGYFGGDAKALRRWIAHAKTSATPFTLDILERSGHVKISQADELVRWRNGLAEVLADIPAARGAPAPLDTIGIEAAFHPYVTYASDRLQTLMATHLDGLFIYDPGQLTADLINALRRRLKAVGLPSMAMGVNIFRLGGKLEGDTSQERARAFSQLLLSPATRRKIMAMFPVLDRLLIQITIDTCDAWSEFLVHLTQDRDVLRAAFGCETQRIDRIEFNLGDPHKCGRSVVKITLDAIPLIYKPRNLATDTAFARLVAELSAETGLGMVSLPTVACGEHGWMAFAREAPCESEDEVRDCYRRIGLLLCALYLTGGNDLHHENLICAGAMPHVIDLETMFFPWVRYQSKVTNDAARARGESVLRIGYLPNAYYVGGARVDFSAAGLFAEQAGPMGHVVDASLRDDAKMLPVEIKLHPTASAPKLNGEIRPAFQYQDEIIEGFSAAYAAVLALREDLVGPPGCLSAFEDICFRWVARPTSQYGTMLRNAYHPRFLRDGAERDMAFAELSRHGAFRRAQHIPLVEAELRDLWRCDIPIFTASSSSLDVQDSRGGTIVGMFEKTGHAAMLERLFRMDEADRLRQVGTIRRSFAAAALGEPNPRNSVPVETAAAPAKDRLVELAADIGERLLRSAHMQGGAPHWVGLEKFDDASGVARFLNHDLYGGAPGIGVFFGELGLRTGEPRFTRMAQACLLVTRRPSPATERRRLGGFTGVASLIYADLRIGEAVGGRSLTVSAKRLEHIGRHIGQDKHLDVIAGAAGALIVALRAAQWPELTDVAMEAALACGGRLEETATLTDDYASWACLGNKNHLTGFSHGTSGIAVALVALAKASGERRFAELAWKALRYEEASFDEATGAWRDLRHDDVSPGRPATMAWCHGTPGMVLARQLIVELDLPEMPVHLKTDVNRGVAALRKPTVVGGHCLCHGGFGNLEPLHRVGRSQRGYINAMTGALIAEAEAEDWLCDVQFPVPGLMTGLSGIGLGLLRSAFDDVPSVLALETGPDGRRGWGSAR